MYRPLLHIIELCYVTPSQSSQYIFWQYFFNKMVVSKKTIIIHTILINFNTLYLAKNQHAVNSSISKKAKQLTPLMYSNIQERRGQSLNKKNKPWRNQNYRRKQEMQMENPCLKSFNEMVSRVCLHTTESKNKNCIFFPATSYY